ncbi:hypothetical protein [Marinobacter persicus]|uniref:Uncharacterized protein n=1 Tax=Marinobacter persicus TaxID=930118 RepID=A0A2S6G915_9GAMM|nr:hypothetical protein [Marinobacter persicus]PPK52717.1 hypothetical protein BY455_10434 [Marinobacter persicus]PPK55737.1 hypothetical protein B0H24_1004141 [Marinobacter persicus]PPK59228.1 hypothetical protein BY454_10434 [Marinobacter persicus]
MEPIAIRLTETTGIARNSEPVFVGVPLARGLIRDASKLALTVANSDQPLPACFTVLCRWPDASIRWVLVEFETDLAPRSDQTLWVREATNTASNQPMDIDSAIGGWQIQTAGGTFRLTSNQPIWQNQSNAGSITTQPELRDEHGSLCKTVADADWHLRRSGSLYVYATLTGQWLRPDDSPLARFHCQLRISSHTGVVRAQVQIHNPNRARHPGGLWDLGDEGSVLFRSLELVTNTSGHHDTASLQADATAPDSQWQTAAEVTLYQDSSGGENWDSLNHVDRHQERTTHLPGYRLLTDGAEASGKRANPQLKLSGPEYQLQIAVPGFWQNFPSSIHHNNQTTAVGLFPAQPDNRLHELQGGERRTLCCLFSYQDPAFDLAWAYAPLVPVLPGSTYQQAHAFPWFSANAEHDPLSGLLQLGLDGPSNFFAKREAIDEYGWRNFGDIFADHECLYQPDDEPPLVSHYNNQYDALYGFARQFAATGDRRWFELMNDLASHVADIDIYHTQKDRSEYNNGLFWHTDHYLPAQTATHRTFSRHNQTSSTPGQTGGGPGAEHCYTTGLLYHYLMTGQATSREAVMDLTRWMVGLHEGCGGFLEQVLAVKKQDLPKIKAILHLERPTRHRYPLTRGTGNYLNALLDAHLLEPGYDWLERARDVIEQTCHPDDDLDARNLLDREANWHYLVFLSSLCRYLLLSHEAECHDWHYQYALACFRHYTRWIVENEQPFLAQSEDLEFDNHTWAAQDIRKAMLMYQAACFDPEYRNRYLEKGQQWLDYVVSTLEKSPEKHFTRIQMILLQNHGPHLATMTLPEVALQTDLIQASRLAPPVLPLPELLGRVTARVFRGLKTFRLDHERAWLASRLDRR